VAPIRSRGIERLRLTRDAMRSAVVAHGVRHSRCVEMGWCVCMAVTLCSCLARRWSYRMPRWQWSTSRPSAGCSAVSLA